MSTNKVAKEATLAYVCSLGDPCDKNGVVLSHVGLKGHKVCSFKGINKEFYGLKTPEGQILSFGELISDGHVRCMVPGCQQLDPKDPAAYSFDKDFPYVVCEGHRSGALEYARRALRKELSVSTFPQAVFSYDGRRDRQLRQLIEELGADGLWTRRDLLKHFPEKVYTVEFDLDNREKPDFETIVVRDEDALKKRAEELAHDGVPRQMIERWDGFPYGLVTIPDESDGEDRYMLVSSPIAVRASRLGFRYSGLPKALVYHRFGQRLSDMAQPILKRLIEGGFAKTVQEILADKERSRILSLEPGADEYERYYDEKSLRPAAAARMAEDIGLIYDQSILGNQEELTLLKVEDGGRELYLVVPRELGMALADYVSDQLGQTETRWDKRSKTHVPQRVVAHPLSSALLHISRREAAKNRRAAAVCETSKLVASLFDMAADNAKKNGRQERGGRKKTRHERTFEQFENLFTK
ncbi:MAG: hypothetical protein ACOZBH_05340 [Patescibacteria group bacterium]